MPYEHYAKWRAKWLDASGKQQSKTFDDFRSASAHENRMKSEAHEVKQGLRAPTPPRRIFGQLCDEWLETRAKRKRSEGDDISIIKCHLRPVFGELALDSIRLALPRWNASSERERT